MTQYIEKAKVVAEIDAKRDKIKKRILSTPLTGQERAVDTLRYNMLGRIKDFLNTLEVKEVVEHDDSDLDIVISELGVEPDSSALRSRKKNAIRAAIHSSIAKLWVDGDTIYLEGVDPEKAESFILSLAEYGYDTKELLNEYKRTGKITI